MSEQQIPTTTRPRKQWNAPLIISLIVTLGYFSTLWYVLILPVQTESERVLDIMLGALTTVWIGCMGFFFGTTAGSQKKTEMLAKAGPIDAGTP